VENQKKTWQQQQMEQQVRAEVEKELIATLDQAGLPKTRFTANRLVYWKKQNLKNGYDAPPEVLIQQVKDEGQNILQSYVKESSPAQLIEFLGEELINKIRQHDIENLKAKLGQKGTVMPKQARQTAQKGGGKSMRDVDKYFNDLRRSR